MKKIIVIFCIISTIVLGAFASGSSDTDGGTITVAGIVFQNDLYMRTVQLGMEAAGKDLGVTVLLGNSDNKVDKEANLIDTYIARGVGTIIITPIGLKGSSAALQRAADAGIKIVYFNTRADVPGVSHIGTSNGAVGKAAGVAAKKFIQNNLSGQKVEVATISFRSQLPESADQRTNGFFNEIKGMSGVTLVAEQDAWLAEMAVRVVGDMLTAHPNIKIIHAANEGGTVGAVQAVRNAGKAGEVFVFGTDGSDQIVQMLLDKDNVLQSAVAQEPFLVGKTSVDVAVKDLKGEAVESSIDIPPRPLLRNNPDNIKAYQKELQSYN